MLVFVEEFGCEDDWVTEMREGIFNTPLRRSVVCGLLITLAGAVWSIATPDHMNYIFMPGMLTIYAVSGGVHGYSSGVHLPSLVVWYVLGGITNLFIYSGLAFLIFRRRNPVK